MAHKSLIKAAVDTLCINNAFNAPVYFYDTLTSTMDAARECVQAAHGTVVAADYQSAGRGRRGSAWQAQRGENLFFTVILRYTTLAAIPRCLTLKAGLAVSRAMEDFAAAHGQAFSPGGVYRALAAPKVKWPNDIMLHTKDGTWRKAVGILTEAENAVVYIGIGVNIAQTLFSGELEKKACSIVQALLADTQTPPVQLVQRLKEHRFALLERILSRLYDELETSAAGADSSSGTAASAITTTAAAAAAADWKDRLEDSLYLKGQRVRFIPGLPETSSALAPVEGTLHGIGEDGELIIKKNSGGLVSFVSGQLQL